MSSSQTSGKLKGINEILLGNEKKVLSCLPIIMLSNNEYAIVGELGWTQNGHGLSFISEKELKDDATVFDEVLSKEIGNYEIVVLFGHKWYSSLLKINGKINQYNYSETIGLLGTSPLKWRPI